MSSSSTGEAPVRARRKWVSHGLSNAIVYGGLHYGARWLPMPVLNGISVFGNTLATLLMRKTMRGVEQNAPTVDTRGVKLADGTRVYVDVYPEASF